MWTLSWRVFPDHLSHYHAFCTLNQISGEIPLHAKVRVSGKFCHSGKWQGISESSARYLIWRIKNYRHRFVFQFSERFSFQRIWKYFHTLPRTGSKIPIMFCFFFMKALYYKYFAFRLFAINCAMWTLSLRVFPHHLSHNHAFCTLNQISEEITFHAKVRVSGKFCHSGKWQGISDSTLRHIILKSNDYRYPSL